MACPQPAEADIRPLDGNSRFDPTETLAAKFAVMHNAAFLTTVW
jgi:hypothetical protein